MFRTLAEWIAPDQTSPAPLDRPKRLPTSGFGALEHIDARDGLRRCLGNASLYRRLLRAFVETQRGFDTAFREDIGRW